MWHIVLKELLNHPHNLFCFNAHWIYHNTMFYLRRNSSFIYSFSPARQTTEVKNTTNKTHQHQNHQYIYEGFCCKIIMHLLILILYYKVIFIYLIIHLRHIHIFFQRVGERVLFVVYLIMTY